MAIKYWLDDERPAPEGWIQATSLQEFALYLAEKPWLPDNVSFDHDLGTGDISGMTCLRLLEKVDKERFTTVSFHTANPVGRENMESFAKCAGFTIINNE